MGLRCLLGHDFGAPEIERDREEDGDEMVVTVREVKTCERCGERRIVSENKEVTSIRTPAELGIEDEIEEGATEPPAADAADGDDETGGSDAGPGTEPAVEAHTTADEDDGVILEEEADERQHGEWPDAEDVADDSGAGTVEAAEGASESDEDDGANDGADPEREDRTVRPNEGAELIDDTVDEEPDGQTADASSWPEQQGEDEGFTADSADSGAGDVTFGGGGLTPDIESAESEESRREPIDDAEYVGTDDQTEPIDDDFVRAGDSSSHGSTAPGTETEFYCPNCGLTAVAGESSMRAGDICPDCHKGYVAERVPGE